MATYPQRAQAYADALLNKVSTQAQVDRIAIALARRGNRYAEYQIATAAMKAQILIEEARKLAINIVMDTEARAAAQAAADAAVVTTNADFTEGP